ncbi:hypothetical protein LJB86_06320, partial [Deltaproteobacteria bacterium OttesenSCG-928-M10]|nr:hypothetical protein [Deltaproteobacteria bacterium OttesenSCG-928-M10]
AAGPQTKPSPLANDQNQLETPAATEMGRKESRKQEAEARRELAARRRPLNRLIEETETRLAEIADRKNELHQALADPATYQDNEKARLLNQEFQALSDEAAALEQKWEQAMTDLEEIK